MSTGFHGKSLEEIVDLKCKEYFNRQDRERREREALQKAQAENKADTAAQATQSAPTPHAHPILDKIKHVLHLDR